jgi:predicted dehydrogenase
MKEMRELLYLQKKYDLSVWVNHERRYHPLYQYVKNKIESKEFGEIKTIRASVLTSSSNPGDAFKSKTGGPLLHDGTHAIDYLHFLLGKPESVYSKIRKKNPADQIEEQALALLYYKNGIVVFLEAGGARNYFQFEIDIQTSSARFILSNDGSKFFISKKSRLYKGFNSLRRTRLPEFHPKEMNPWINLYREIYEISVGQKKEILGSLGANMEILETIEAIYQAENLST